MKNAKVYIGIVLHDSKRYIFSEFISSLQKFTYKNIHISFMDNSEDNDFQKEIKELGYEYEKGNCPEVPKEKLSKKRNITHLHAFNKLLKKFKESDCTYFYSLECDILPPENIIEHLLSFDKQVIGQWYNVMFDLFELHPCIHKKGYTRTEFHRWIVDFYEPGELTGSLMEVIGCGIGCLLMKRSAFDNIERIKFYGGLNVSVDYLLCLLFKKEKIPCFVDTSFKLRHVQGWVKEV